MYDPDKAERARLKQDAGMKNPHTDPHKARTFDMFRHMQRVMNERPIRFHCTKCEVECVSRDKSVWAYA